MQLLVSKSIVMNDMLNGQMIINNPQFYGKFRQMRYAAVPTILSPRMHLNMEHRPRRRRSNHSVVATMDPVAVARRNERERNRVKQVNDGFDALRKKVPFLPDKKKLSKVEILRYAMMYIKDLKGVVEEFDHNNTHLSEHIRKEGSLSSSTASDDDCILLEEDLDEDLL